MSTTSEVALLSFTQVDQEWSQLTLVETRSARVAWRPAINAFSSLDRIVVFVEAAGVPADHMHVTADRKSVTIHGERPLPEPDCARAELVRLLALEIDHGGFERTLALPQEIDPARVTRTYCDGLLRVDLPLASSQPGD